MQQGPKDYIKKHKKELIEKFASESKYPSLEKPTTIFMAGSPGAGKTEESKKLVEKLYDNYKILMVRIDADEIRQICPGYEGYNAHLFQEATTLGVNKLFDHVLRKRMNALLDTTFCDFERAKDNIQRSLKKGREVVIHYVFQDPTRAWELTWKREKVEGRRITLDVFVKDFIKAKENVSEIKKFFGDKIEVDLLRHDYNNNLENFRLNIDDIDNYIDFSYNHNDLYDTLKKLKI